MKNIILQWTFLLVRGHLREKSSNTITPGKPLFDSYLRSGCGDDQSPESERLSFAEHACNGLPSCLLKNRPMEPDVCFNFCRYHNKGFFIIQGNDCYCTTYYTPNTITAGCLWLCEGDRTQRCGGPKAGSTFAMHRSGDSEDEAALSLKMAEEGQTNLAEATGKLDAQVKSLRNMAKAWNFECGSRPAVCNYDDLWWRASDTLVNYSRSVEKVRHEISDAVTELTHAQANLTDETYGIMEKASDVAKKMSITSETAAQSISAEVEGPTKELQSLDESSSAHLFIELGDTEKQWHAICDLEILHQMSGLEFSALEETKAAEVPEIPPPPETTPAPTAMPSAMPTEMPTAMPTEIPTDAPTEMPAEKNVMSDGPMDDEMYDDYDDPFGDDEPFPEDEANDWGDGGGDGEWEAFEDGDEFDDDWFLHHKKTKTLGAKNARKAKHHHKRHKKRHHHHHKHHPSLIQKRHHLRRVHAHHQSQKGVPKIREQAFAWCINHRDCVGFNMQTRSDGVFGVQFLTKKGLITPDDRIAEAIPIFHISEDKIASMEFESIGCFAKKAFMGNNGYGPTKVHVYKDLIVK